MGRGGAGRDMAWRGMVGRSEDRSEVSAERDWVWYGHRDPGSATAYNSTTYYLNGVEDIMQHYSQWHYSQWHYSQWHYSQWHYSLPGRS